MILTGPLGRTICLLFFPVMKTYAEFWINNKNLKEQEFRIKDKNKSKTWFGGRTDIPLDVPVCGFENELCPDKPKSDSKLT